MISRNFVASFCMTLLGWITITKVCGACPNITSDTEILKVDGYLSEEECKWTIPEEMLTEGYLILKLKINHLSGDAYLNISGLIYNQLNGSDSCSVYSNYTTNCANTNLYKNISKACNNTSLLGNVTGPQFVILNSLSENDKKRRYGFSIQFIQIPCNKTTSETTSVATKRTGTFGPAEELTSTSPYERVTESRLVGSVSSLVIGLAVGAACLIAILMIAFVIWRIKTTSNKTEESASSNLRKSQPQEPKSPRSTRTAYANSLCTIDEAGYEIPRNARQYENFRTEGQYENLKDDETYEDVEQDETYVNTELYVP